MPGFLSERDAAVYLGVSIWTVQRWRKDGWGPDYLRLTGIQGSPFGTVRYSVPVLKQWAKRKNRTAREQVHRAIWGDKPYRVISGKYATPTPSQSPSPAPKISPTPTPGDPPTST